MTPDDLKQMLIDRQWSQADLAHRAGVATSAVSRFLTGKRGLGHSVLVRLSAALGLPLDGFASDPGTVRALEAEGRCRALEVRCAMLEAEVLRLREAARWAKGRLDAALMRDEKE